MATMNQAHTVTAETDGSVGDDGIAEARNILHEEIAAMAATLNRRAERLPCPGRQILETLAAHLLEAHGAPSQAPDAA